MSAFYIGYCTTQLVGGLLSKKFGGKKTIWVGLSFGAFCALAIPFAVSSYHMVLVLRVLMGLCLGPVYPSFSQLLTKWIPSGERSLAAGLIWSGSSVGTVFIFFVGPYIVHSNVGWKGVFYMIAAFAAGSALVCCFLLLSISSSVP